MAERRQTLEQTRRQNAQPVVGQVERLETREAAKYVPGQALEAVAVQEQVAQLRQIRERPDGNGRDLVSTERDELRIGGKVARHGGQHSLFVLNVSVHFSHGVLHATNARRRTADGIPRRLRAPRSVYGAGEDENPHD